MRRQATDQKKIFAKDIPDKGHYPKYPKIFLKLSDMTIYLKQQPKILTEASHTINKTERWQITIWKDASDLLPLGEYKLKQ